MTVQQLILVLIRLEPSANVYVGHKSLDSTLLKEIKETIVDGETDYVELLSQ
jgi:hypothetical protein